MDMEDLLANENRQPPPRPSTLLDKILRRHVVPAESSCHLGSFVNIVPRFVMTHDNSAAVIAKFHALAVDKIRRPSQLVFCLDHDIQNTSDHNLQRYRKIQAFAATHGIDFHPAGRGIGHQVLIEEGYVLPGTVVVASDSHSNMYGALGCLGTPVVRTDAACIWATGQTWWKVPPVAKVELRGHLDKSKGIRGKDLIIALCGRLNKDQVLNHAVEFSGPGVSSLSMDERMTISNMSTEWGALCAIFPVDDVTIHFLQNRVKVIQAALADRSSHTSASSRLPEIRAAIHEMHLKPLQADENAIYQAKLIFDLSSLSSSMVCGPHDVKTLLADEKRIPIDKAFLISCVNSRVEDLADAANVLHNLKIHQRVKMYVAAASSEVQMESEKRGDWQTLIRAGAIPLPPGCGPCIGLGAGTMQAGEVGVSSTNRNFRGRMGSRDSEVYLASPRVVAQSAIEGFISISGDYRDLDIQHDTATSVPPNVVSEKIRIVPGFPTSLSGTIVFCPKDGISTDGIFAGDKTYAALSLAGMADVAMENYDPTFQPKIRSVTGPKILVGGENFGVGSSREQAAQCFKYFDVKAIVTASVGATYTRNAINNGIPLLECPALVQSLKDSYCITSQQEISEDRLTLVSKEAVCLDFVHWCARWRNREIPMEAIGAPAQEILVAGGLEYWIAHENAKISGGLV